jgi:Ca-activated chloride channel family protein
MTSRLLLLVSLSLLPAWQAARAQNAEEFFNSGAQLYISNNIPQALESTETGLKQYPNDAKLKKLEALLKQQNQQQNQSQQSQQQNQQSSAKNSHDQQKQDEQKQSQAEQRKQQEQQKASAPKNDGEKQDQKDAEGQPVAAGQMTPEEAKRLLDAQKGNEQVLQLKPQGKPENQNRPVKDW